MTVFDSKKYTTEDGFIVRIEYHGDDNDAPWDREDGLGDVREVHAPFGNPDKKPGERVLHYERSSYWLYNWQDACKKARAEGWNAKPYDAPGRIERAVQADFDYLRGYLRNDWQYAGVLVSVCDTSGKELEQDACWGFETLNNYHEQAGQEMADYLLERVRAERVERHYWETRDVETVGA